MLQNSFSGAEGAGHTEGAAFGYGQEGVDTADLSHKRFIGPQTLLIAADGLLYRPGKDHGQLPLLALFVFQHRHGVAYIVYALFPDGFDRPLICQVKGDHDQMGEQTLRHAADGITCGDHITGGDPGGELPIPVGNGIQIHTTLQEKAAFFRQLGQGILQAIEHLGQQARPQLYAHKLAGELYLVAHLDAVCHFIDLHAGCVAVYADDLTLKSFVTHQDIAHFIFSHGAGEAGRYQVPVYSGHKSCYFVHIDSPVLL